MDEFDLKGEVALVTGGNGGIGRGIAVGLARAGAEIVIAARNEAKTAEARAEIEALGRRCLGVRCDVSRREDVQAAVRAALESFGKLSIVVANAGIAVRGAPQALAEADWLRVLGTNLNGVFYAAQAAYPALLANGGGRVITIGSEFSLFGSPTVSSYSASKGGVVQLTKSLAVAWAKDNIRVNCIIPGWVRTDLTAPLMADKESYERIVGRTPARRFAEPEELAGAAVFLASRASNFVTGQNLVVDGGYSIA
ncbi:MAG TPA: glucose 1-dehydrogenase [Dehalococcoidia bacterium]|nr:glucose 1-dehydrogenase [Dehalococcoidia bacterium]